MFIDNLIIKGMCVIFLLTLKINLLQVLKPYKVLNMNRVALFSTYASYISIYFGIFYAKGLETKLMLVMTIALFVSNILFLSFWTLLFYRATKDKIINVYRKILSIGPLRRFNK